jgi:hypothetical protein
VTIVDTNVLLDVFTGDPDWSEWSTITLDRAATRGSLIINDVIYAELSPAFSSRERLDLALAQLRLDLQPIPRQALFLAGRAFQRYRKAGGLKGGVLSDFFIGAHASVQRLPLLTRDTRSYRSYFPDVTLVAPDR